jgi:hypothetical protein
VKDGEQTYGWYRTSVPLRTPGAMIATLSKGASAGDLISRTTTPGPMTGCHAQ